MQTVDSKKLRIIDVSQKITPAPEPVGPDDFARMCIEESMVWPIKEYASYVDDTIYQIIQLKTHVKTHIESPYHLDGKGKPLSAFQPDTFLGRMVYFYFDVPAGTVLTREMLEKADGGRLKGGDIVVLRTSWSKEDGGEPPVVEKDGAQYFLEKKIKMFGQDESLTVGGATAPDTAHDIFLKHNVPLLEMLCNLDQITQDVSFIVAIPGLMKIEGIDSSTTQAVIIEGMEVL